MTHFSSKTPANSPGKTLVCDVIKRAKQVIFVARDTFSDFVTTSFIGSEKAEDLKTALTVSTNAVRSNAAITVWVDSASGFKSLAKNNRELSYLGISIELSDSNNKNGLAIVDKAIQELEKDIKTLSPEGRGITPTILAKSTMTQLKNKEQKPVFVQNTLFLGIKYWK